MNNKPQKLEISTSTILKVIFILLGIYLIYLLRSVVLIVLIIFVLDAAFGPVVDRLEGRKIPRWLGAIIVYLLIIGVLTGFAFLVVPPLVSQVINLVNNAPATIEHFAPIYNWVLNISHQQGNIADFAQNNLQNILGQINHLSANFVSATLGIFSSIASLIIIAVLLFYLLIKKDSFAKSVVYFLPKDKEQKYLEIAKKISVKWGSWFRGQIILSIIMGILVWAGLSIIGVPYAITLAVLAAFTEFIPVLGPWLGGIPAVLIALSVNIWIALIVAAFYLGIQQLESLILAPKIMQKTVGLSPVIIIIAILIAGELFGLFGIILAVPITAGIVVLIDEWKASQK
jgi:predicted PurR-regulated permease PerM